MKTYTEDQWLRKMLRHIKWDKSWRAELAALESTLDSLDEIQAVQAIAERAAAIERRAQQLKKIMERHIERAPASLLPEVRRALGIQVQ